MNTPCHFTRPGAFAALLALTVGLVAGCDKPEQPVVAGPAQQLGAKIDEAAAVTASKLEDFKDRHAPQIEAAKNATQEGVRKLTGAVGETMEKAGQKAQDVAKESEKR